jgi:hypothetical protein
MQVFVGFRPRHFKLRAQDIKGGIRFIMVVYLSPADKYPRLTRGLSKGQKGLDEKALMAS